MPKINFFVPVSGKPRTLELAQLDCPVPEVDSQIEINGQSYAVAKVDRSYNRCRDTVEYVAVTLRPPVPPCAH
jgi:hypothetical protein